MDKPKNIYAVVDAETGKTVHVRAKGLASAIDHVAKGRFTGRLLKGGEVADVYESGATIETAGETEQNTDPEPTGQSDEQTDKAPNTKKKEQTTDG